MEPHNTIRLVKALIEEKEGIPVSQQRLVVPRDSLQDDRRLSDIDTEVLVLHVRMSIFVYFLTGKTIILDVWDGDTIKRVQAKIHDMEALPCDQQRLMFGGQYLEEEHTLSDYNIQHLATIQCNIIMNISVQTSTGEIMTMDVDTSETIGNVMQRVATKYSGLSTAEQHFVIMRRA